jgi:bacillithiol synthase
VTLPVVLTEPLGGGPLPQRVIAGDAPPAWYPPRPSDVEGWRARAEEVRGSVPRDWYARLSLAFGATGAAQARLARVSAAGGVVVTTGQQPGLFGGPIYTWSKAISALELADEIERETGVPAAPVFWAATDDADFAEAAETWVALAGGAARLTMSASGVDGVPMADYPLGDVRDAIDVLAAASGSAVAPDVVDVVRLSYHANATVGGAYLTLLRVLLEPLGIAVLDASHAALLDAERPWLARALEHGASIATALQERSAELRAAGHLPQVADVDGLSLVFGRDAGRKVRIPLSLAASVAARADRERISPNVLLRPVVERAVLPTVAYVAGPGEIAYFAQVSAVASTLRAAAPLVVPRWSCTIVEPHVQALLSARDIGRHEVVDVAALEGRLARATAPVSLTHALSAWRGDIERAAGRFGDALDDTSGLLPRAVVDGVRRQMLWRAERLERRMVAAVKRRDVDMRRDVGTIAGALRPGGRRQERALNLLPMLARHGLGVLDRMRDAARRHAEALVHGTPLPVDPA